MSTLDGILARARQKIDALRQESADPAAGAARPNLCPRCAARRVAEKKTITDGEQLALNPEDAS